VNCLARGSDDATVQTVYEAAVRCVCTCAHFRLYVLVFADFPFIIFVSCTKNTTKRNARSSKEYNETFLEFVRLRCAMIGCIT
jgi:hypothetical protein